MADEQPSYTIKAESENIVVRHTGKLTMQVLKSSRREATRLATATHLARFLYDVTGAVPSLETVDVFELCVSNGSVLPSDAAVAVVFRPDQFSVEDVRFGEIVSLNRGTRLRTFTDHKAAEQWLSAICAPPSD
jgi:hypothetical protein